MYVQRVTLNGAIPSGVQGIRYIDTWGEALPGGPFTITRWQSTNIDYSYFDRNVSYWDGVTLPITCEIPWTAGSGDGMTYYDHPNGPHTITAEFYPVEFEWDAGEMITSKTIISSVTSTGDFTVVIAPNSLRNWNSEFPYDFSTDQVAAEITVDQGFLDEINLSGVSDTPSVSVSPGGGAPETLFYPYFLSLSTPVSLNFTGNPGTIGPHTFYVEAQAGATTHTTQSIQIETFDGLRLYDWGGGTGYNTYDPGPHIRNAYYSGGLNIVARAVQAIPSITLTSTIPTGTTGGTIEGFTKSTWTPNPATCSWGSGWSAQNFNVPWTVRTGLYPVVRYGAAAGFPTIEHTTWVAIDEHVQNIESGMNRDLVYADNHGSPDLMSAYHHPYSAAGYSNWFHVFYSFLANPGDVINFSLTNFGTSANLYLFHESDASVNLANGSYVTDATGITYGGTNGGVSLTGFTIPAGPSGRYILGIQAADPYAFYPVNPTPHVSFTNSGSNTYDDVRVWPSHRSYTQSQSLVGGYGPSSLTFYAFVSGPHRNDPITWTTYTKDGGLAGTISSGGLYTPPTGVGSTGYKVIRATVAAGIFAEAVVFVGE